MIRGSKTSPAVGMEGKKCGKCKAVSHNENGVVVEYKTFMRI
jgi:hypothetical protein